MVNFQNKNVDHVLFHMNYTIITKVNDLHNDYLLPDNKGEWFTQWLPPSRLQRWMIYTMTTSFQITKVNDLHNDYLLPDNKGEWFTKWLPSSR